ncbi:MAG TPA: carboxypeptidase regulatory-like domain-containing protein [Candidatus Acidoferrales bacterium]|nr:carboxypeptidase regulatory-like domain-containing protein [Candidatus Acidoferrales bacterium]
MRKMRMFVVLTCTLILAGLCAQGAFAQAQTTGDISGVVKDPQGSSVAGATVTVKNMSTSATASMKTNDEGIFRFALLEPGDYSVTVDAEGLQSATTNTVVRLGQVSSLEMKLTLKGTTQTVAVTAEAPIFQTENGNNSTNLTLKQIQEVPNGGNDIYDILWYAAGAVVARGGTFPSFFGLPTSSNMVSLNGMPDIDPDNNATNGGASNLLLGLNEVQEATVVPNGYTGEYGTLAGSNTTIVTKSGTNKFHGDLKYYWSGRAVDANSYFHNSVGTPRSFQNANQYAGDVGGPILKNKLFVYFNTEGVRIILPASSNFTYLPTSAFETATTTNLTTLGLTNSLPFYTSMFNLWNKAPGASSASSAGIPTGTAGSSFTGPGCGTFTGLGTAATPALAAALPACSVRFASVVPNYTPETIYSFRVDYNISSKDHAFVHYFRDDGVQATSTDTIDPKDFNVISPQPSWNSEIVETHTFNSNMLNQVTLGAEWYHALFAPTNFAQSLATMPYAVSFQDGSLNSLGSSVSGFPQGRAITSAEFSDDFSWQKGRHSFKFGGVFDRYDMSNYFSTTRSMSVANLDAFYNGGFDPGTPSGNSTTYTQSFPLSTDQPFAMYRLGAYVTDTLRIRNNLSVTLALRVDHASNPVCRTVCMANLSTPFLTGGNTASTPYNQAISTGLFQGFKGYQSLEWQPRLGFAWQVRGGNRPTVLRGGIGLFGDNYAFSLATAFANNAPNTSSFAVTSLGYISPAQTTSSGNPLQTDAITDFTAFKSGFLAGDNLTQLQAAVKAAGGTFAPPNFTTTAPYLNLPQYQEWNIQVQQGLWHNASLNLAYNGNHGIHELLSVGGYNAFGLAGFPATPLNPLFKSVTYFQPSGTSHYNGMTVSFQYRFGGGALQANYMWSHAFDIGEGTGQTRTVLNPYSLASSISVADIDVRHYMDATYVWTLPIQKLIHTQSGALSRAIEGWQVSGTIIARSGFPLNFTDTSLNSTLTADNYGGATPFANWSGAAIPSCNVPVYSGTTAVSCFPSGLFSKLSKSSLMFGNTPRNVLIGPGYFDTDFALMKNFKIWENWTLGIGAQAYNVLNHVNFSIPGTNINSSSTFGLITSTVGPSNSVYGSGLGADSSPRLLQIKAQVSF